MYPPNRIVNFITKYFNICKFINNPNKNDYNLLIYYLLQNNENLISNF